MQMLLHLWKWSLLCDFFCRKNHHHIWVQCSSETCEHQNSFRTRSARTRECVLLHVCVQACTFAVYAERVHHTLLLLFVLLIAFVKALTLQDKRVWNAVMFTCLWAALYFPRLPASICTSLLLQYSLYYCIHANPQTVCLFDWLWFLQKKMYRNQLEPMLVQHVFPEFRNPLGYMRARVSNSGRY